MFFLPCSVNLNYIKINNIGTKSNISTGSNVSINRNTKTHINEGFGEENADFASHHISISYVDDSDFFDQVIEKKQNGNP